MNTRSLINLVLLVILLAFAGFFITSKNQPVKVSNLTQLRLDEINLIQIPRDQAEDILLKKTSNSDNKTIWQMLTPYKIKAHQFRINTLLGLTQTPIDKFYNIKDLELAQYALDKPRASIIFNTTKISFGKSNPLNNKRYLMTEQKMVLVNDQLYPLVSSQPATFIDLSLLLPENKIVSIQTPEVTITSSDTDHWKSIPENRLNADQVQNLLAHWKNSQAFAVHSYMPRKKLGNINIQLKNSTIKFEISDDDPWLILARPDLGIEYHLDNSLKDKLLGITNTDLTDA